MVAVLVGAIAGAAIGAGGYGVATQDEAQAQQSDVGGRTIDAHQIYQQITGGPGGRSLVDGQQAASTLQRRYQDRADRIAELNRKMEANWTGEGGTGAARGAEPLKVWMEDSSTNLGHANTALEDQYGAFNTVSGTVRPVSAQPPESGLLNDLAPWETDLDEKIHRYNEDARTNVDAFNTYFHSSTANAQRMPSYGTLRGQYGNINVETAPGVGDGAGSGGGYGGGYGGYGGGTGRAGGYSPGGVGGAGGGYSAASIPAANVGPGAAAGGAGYGPGGGYGGGYSGGYSGGYGSNYPGAAGYGGSQYDSPGYEVPEWGGDTGTGTAGYTPAPYNAPGAGSTTGFGPGTGGLGTGGYGSSAYGGSGAYGSAGSSGGAYGAGAYGGFGPRGSGSLSGGAVSGSAVPGSSSATGGYTGTARAGSTSGSGMGRPMMGPMGAGRGQGGEDEEHERKYLIEEDANELFGTDQKTPPPVIGE